MIGQVIDGRYVVEAVLGQGGMGVVLRARHQFTGATVAVKMLRADMQVDAIVAQRFLGEARAPSAIGHPGIVQVLDAGCAPDGTLYLVMELLTGQTLRAAIRGGLTAVDARRIALELLDALAAAHARGFVHRDLKPENVFLTPGVKLLDFGIAKSLGANFRTVAGLMMGTPGYMAPEQLMDASTVDARADLWAVGIMLYEMLSGRLPFHARTHETMLVAVTRDPIIPIEEALPTAPPALSPFFARALARDPAQRFASAQELAAAIAALPLGSAMAPPASRVPGATVASVAPPMMHQGATVASMAPGATVASIAPPAPPSVSPRNATRNYLVIAIVGVIAVAAVVIVAVLARGGHATTPTVVVDAKPAVDAAVVVPIDASAIPSCKDACKRIVDCDLELASLCESECENLPAVNQCRYAALEGCEAFAACTFQVNCGAPPSGARTCRATLAAQAAECPVGDFACGCKHAKQAARMTTVQLYRVDYCALHAACDGNLACIAQACQVPIAACNMR